MPISKTTKLGNIVLPGFSGIRILMMPFWLEDVAGTLPDFLSGWERSIQELVDLAPCQSGVAYLTIDEAVVQAGTTHRRPGLHVDGWRDDSEGLECSGGGWGSPSGSSGGFWGGPEYPIAEDPPAAKFPPPSDPKPPRPPRRRENIVREIDLSGWLTISSIVGCRAWNQAFTGEPRKFGDCEHLRSQFAEENAIVLEPGTAYHLNSLAVHESLPQRETAARQFVRLSMPSAAGWPSSCTANPLGVRPGGPILPPRPDAFTNYGEKHMG